MNELDYIYKVRTDISGLDVNGYIKPQTYQVIINKVAEEHLEKFNISFEDIMKYDLGWVLVSLSVDVKKHIKGCSELEIRTWYSGNRGPCFRREIEAKDVNGDIVFVASTYSILLDMKTRSIYRKKELPFELSEIIDIKLTKAVPNYRGKYTFENITTRKMERSYIDCLGHVNNCKYGEIAFDSILDNEADLSKIEGFNIYFISELKQNNMIDINKYNDKNTIAIQGFDNQKNVTSFVVEFLLNKF